jgi:hypothetical protein
MAARGGAAQAHRIDGPPASSDLEAVDDERVPCMPAEDTIVSALSRRQRVNHVEWLPAMLVCFTLCSGRSVL